MFRTFSASVACALLAGCTAHPTTDTPPTAMAQAVDLPHLRPGGSAVATPTVQSGLASWYGPRHQGRRTASGVRFDMKQRTAAHPTLPMGTRVRVSDPMSGRSVVVTVNDRGPHVSGRIIDLSWRAASDLGITNAGIAMVRLDVLLSGHRPVPVAPASRTRTRTHKSPFRTDGKMAPPLLETSWTAP